MTPLLRLAAGAGAGIVGMSATYPLDMVRGRLTVQSMEAVHRYRGIMHATAVIVKEARAHPLDPTTVMCRHQLCYLHSFVLECTSSQQRGLGANWHFRVCMSDQSMHGRCRCNKNDQCKWSHVGLELVGKCLLVCVQEGIIALWKGWLPSVIGVIPYVGLNFAVYETLKDSVLKFYGAPQSRRHCYAHRSCVQHVCCNLVFSGCSVTA